MTLLFHCLTCLEHAPCGERAEEDTEVPPDLESLTGNDVDLKTQCKGCGAETLNIFCESCYRELGAAD